MSNPLKLPHPVPLPRKARTQRSWWWVHASHNLMTLRAGRVQWVHQPTAPGPPALRCHVLRLLVAGGAAADVLAMTAAVCAHNSCDQVEMNSNLLNNTFSPWGQFTINEVGNRTQGSAIIELTEFECATHVELRVNFSSHPLWKLAGKICIY